jgi:hypothetical protein
LEEKRISLTKETNNYFLPEEGTDHHSWEIKVILLNRIHREFPNNLLSQKFSFSQPGKFHKHFLSPYHVPMTWRGAGFVYNYPQWLLRKNSVGTRRPAYSNSSKASLASFTIPGPSGY